MMDDDDQSPTKICEGCGYVITSKYLSLNGEDWHSSCVLYVISSLYPSNKPLSSLFACDKTFFSLVFVYFYVFLYGTRFVKACMFCVHDVCWPIYYEFTRNICDVVYCIMHY